MNNYKKGVVSLVLLVSFSVAAYAANNFIRNGSNWDASVSPSAVANDIFTLNGRLDLEDSLSSRYTSGFRGEISGTINSELFGDFTLPSNLELTFRSNNPGDIPSECGDSLEIYNIGLGERITSPFWGDMFIQNTSYFCSNQYMHLVLRSDSLGTKDLGEGDTTNLVDNFGKQEISISGIAKLKGDGTAGLLARGDQDINRLDVDITSKTVAKTNINKNIALLWKSLFSSNLNKANSNSSVITSFTNTRDENYYFYDYSSQNQIPPLQLSGSNYINTGKNLEVGTDGNGVTSISGKHTVVVKGGNVLINSNIDNGNDSTDLLMIVAKKSTDGKGGNIYVDADVTNIDAILIADRSVISIDAATNAVQHLGESAHIRNLRKQLYVYGSVLSSNSVGTDEIPFGADYYDTTYSLTESIYDLGNLRTFNLNYGTGSVCGDGSQLAPIDGNGGYIQNAWAGRKSCYNSELPQGGLRQSPKRNPVIIEYNSSIKTISPYLLRRN